MNRWLKVVLLVLLVLVSAMVLRNATYASVGGGDNPVLVAHGSGPLPPLPWKSGTAAPQLRHGSGPLPPLPR